MCEKKPERVSMNLEDWSALNEASIRFMAGKMADDLMKPNYLADMLFMGYKPPTKWQRFKNRLVDYKQRCKDIWTILSGGDIHENCGDY